MLYFRLYFFIVFINSLIVASQRDRIEEEIRHIKLEGSDFKGHAYTALDLALMSHRYGIQNERGERERLSQSFEKMKSKIIELRDEGLVRVERKNGEYIVRSGTKYFENQKCFTPMFFYIPNHRVLIAPHSDWHHFLSTSYQEFIQNLLARFTAPDVVITISDLKGGRWKFQRELLRQSSLPHDPWIVGKYDET